MDLTEVYTQRREKFNSLENSYRRKASVYPFLRLTSFIAAPFAYYFLFPFGIAFSIAGTLICLVLFAMIIRQDFKLQGIIRHNALLKEINSQELAALDHDLTAFDGGDEYIDPSHPYTSDLDIFGRASLFRYLNRTTSAAGKHTLASWLRTPAPAEEIKLRQEAVIELQEKIDWRQEFRVNGLKQEKWQQDYQPIIEWLDEPSLFIDKKLLKVACAALPFITVPAVIGTFFFVPSYIAVALVLVHILILRRYAKRVDKSWRKTSERVGLLSTYSELIATVEKERFSSGKAASLKGIFVLGGNPASGTLKDLSTIVDRLDLRLNIYVYPFINILFFWDIHYILKLEKWKARYRGQVAGWFSALGEFEALASLGTLYHNNPHWAIPEVREEGFIINGEEAGHPLIPPNKRVSNDIDLDGRGIVMLVTGSNMAGKSTYLRTIGVNITLAMAGSAVCAKRLVISPVEIYTSMRIIDSLEENASSFYAELRRLESIIKFVKNNPRSFFLLDEILRGTNSNDRHIGSKALIKQMIKYSGTGIIATHDLELSKLENEMPGLVRNFSFDVQVENEQLYFDYKLHKGVCRSLNASILMKKMGIEI
jgi:hypothetical protein